MRIVRVAVAGLFLVGGTAVDAQKAPPPARPALAAGADTNDAHAYYDFALERLSTEPAKAADALYWATRIDPLWADAYYARRVALLLVDPLRYSRYSSGDKKTIAEARSIDSLLYRARTINPFVAQRLERRLMDATYAEVAQRATVRSGSAAALQGALEEFAVRGGPPARARLAANEGLYLKALEHYAEAVKKTPKNSTLRVERARVFFLLDQPDSALADLTIALEEIRKAEKKDLVFIYESRAIIEHSLAMVHQRLGNTAEAKEAFGRALQEDLSYYPAHLNLAFLAMDAKDTVAALAELDLATQLREDDAGAQYLHAHTLVRAGRIADGVSRAKKAIELDPVYAAPRFLYARLLEAADYGEEAGIAYKDFLNVAARNNPQRVDAEARIAALRTPD